MSRNHKTAPISPSFHNGIVFKQKGSRVRFFDPATAKVSPWMRTGLVQSVTDRFEFFQRMTVAELKGLATVKGITFPSKIRKGDLIAALTA